MSPRFFPLVTQLCHSFVVTWVWASGLSQCVVIWTIWSLICRQAHIPTPHACKHGLLGILYTSLPGIDGFCKSQFLIIYKTQKANLYMKKSKFSLNLFCNHRVPHAPTLIPGGPVICCQARPLLPREEEWEGTAERLHMEQGHHHPRDGK